VPGAAGSGAFCTPITERLPDDWIVTAMDLPGLGSVPARDDIRGYDDLAEYVAGIVAAPSAIVAQSMGAYVALRVALRYPHLVTHLVLVAATGGIDVMKCGAVDWRSDYAGTYPQAQSWTCDGVPDLSADLRALEIPVLLIWPTADILSPPAVAERLAATIPTTSLITFHRTITGSSTDSPSNPPRPFARSSNSHYIRGNCSDFSALADPAGEH
jgi:pimeloyl-ACP methyl ester carboxylesterase